MRADPPQPSPPTGEALNREERELERALRAQREAHRRWQEQFLAENPTYRAIEAIVDDRAFVLGLDELYRTAMKRQERHPLLLCAREVASALGIGPADVPIEGYYHEEEELTEYFQLIRALQNVAGSRAGEVRGMPAYERLREVTSSPIHGRPLHGPLLPRCMDALFDALQSVPVWSIDALVARAYEILVESDDCSLLGLAVQTRDPVAIAALRESVVLYAMTLSKPGGPTVARFVWRVDPALAARATRFSRPD